MRIAVYYAPEITDPLWHAGCTWLGRDPETGANVPQPDIEGIEAATASPRLYGFHCTLKPPTRITISYDEFIAAARETVGMMPSFTLPPLRVTAHNGFLCLREIESSAPLHQLASVTVQLLHYCRVPPEPGELERRRRPGLSPAQEAMLVKFGYPHVVDTWFFHMTLTGRMDAEQHAVFRPAAEAHFAAALAVPRRVEWATIYTQSAPGEPFLIAERLPLRPPHDPD